MNRSTTKYTSVRRTDWLVGTFMLGCLLIGGRLIWSAVQNSPDRRRGDCVADSTVATNLSPVAPPSGDRHVAHSSAGGTSHRLFTKPIEQIQVGERVWAENPTGEEDLALGEDVDPATWRHIELLSPKEDGSWADVVLLRPDWWLMEHAELNGKATVDAGDLIEIIVAECGIEGEAEVVAIGPCAPIKPGPGRVVTGTFRHSSANVLDLHIEGLAAPVGTTGNHPFWSEDRQAFVRADGLQGGEQLRTLEGTHVVAATAQRSQAKSVFNIEVQIDHTYFVAECGILVHNPIPCYRDTFFTAFPQLKGKVVVHHRVPQAVLKKYPGMFTPQEIHALSNLTGIPKGVNGPVHLSEINRAWNRFYRNYPNAGRDEILHFVDIIDEWILRGVGLP